MANFGWSLPAGCGTLPGEEDYFDSWTCGECGTWNDAPEDESEWDGLKCEKCDTEIPNPISDASYDAAYDLYQDSFGDTL